MFMHKIAAALILLLGLHGFATAQSIQLGPGQVLANGSAAQRPGGATSLTMNGLLGPTAAYQVGNPGNAALFAQIPNPPGGHVATYNGLVVCQGACVPSLQQFGTDLHGTKQAIVGTNSIPVGDATTGQACGVCGYSITNVAANAAGAGAIGVYGNGLLGVPGGNVFGISAIAQNSNGDQSITGYDANYVGGIESDVLIFKKSGGADPTITSGHVYAYIAAGSSTLAARISNGTGSAAYVADMLSVFTGIPWEHGFQTYAGAAVNALTVGPAGLGANQPSQTILFQSVNAGSVPKTGSLELDQNGSLIAFPTSGTNFVVSAGAGTLQVVSMSVAGVVVNDASGLMTSLASLSVVKGGTNCTSASGTCLDNISGFSSTGYINRTGAGTYTFTASPSPGGTAGGDLSGTYPNPIVANLTSGVTVAGTMLHTNIAAPSTPASGKVITWTDSTDLRFHDKNASGVIGTTVVSDTGAANNYISAISAAGVITKSRPTCSTLSDAGAFCNGTSASSLSGTLQAAQEPAHTGDVTNVAASLALTLATVQPAVHTWALAQTFTVAPVFTDASGTRTALGLGALATVTPGANCATWLATPSSANFASCVTDETGTAGAVVLSLSPTIATPTFTTSFTSPLHIGGSGTTGTQLTFQTTSGVGTTDAFAFKGGNNGATTFATLQTGSFNLQTGSTYSINGTSVLSGSALGSGVTGSSLTSLGTLASLTVSGAVSLTNNGSGGQLFGGTSSDTGQTQFVVSNTSSGGHAWQFATAGSTAGPSPGDFYFYDQTAAKYRFLISSLGNTVIGGFLGPALATSATDGFIYIPTSAGTPTGVPTAYTGHVALLYDTTNHQFWIYDGGWKQPKTPAAAALVTWQ